MAQAHGRLAARWAAIFGAATLLGLLFATRNFLVYGTYPENRVSFGRAAALSLTDWYIWALLAPAILALAARFPVERANRYAGLLAHLPAGLAFAVLYALLAFAVSRAAAWLPDRQLSFLFVASQFHVNLLAYAAIVGGWHLFDYRRRWRERELRASQLEARLAEARLEALRMQLQPHFLFNTLHAVSALMHRDVEAAEATLARLGDLLRMTLERAGAPEVSLREELEFLERYLEIEGTRFGGRLAVEMRIDPEALDARVPNLLLQPLVENAVRHAIAPRAGPGRIEIAASRRDGRLHVEVADDGPGLASPRAGRGPSGTPDRTAGGGVGLANTRARLEGMYGREGWFELRARPGGGLVAAVAIPFRTFPAGAKVADAGGEDG